MDRYRVRVGRYEPGRRKYVDVFSFSFETDAPVGDVVSLLDFTKKFVWFLAEYLQTVRQAAGKLAVEGEQARKENSS